MPVAEKIYSSEVKHKLLLEQYFCNVFPFSYLPSHDLDHHKRVWNNAKKLLHHLTLHGYSFSQTFTDNLIVACYLHDSGLVVNQGPDHGLEGRILCEEFLRKNNLIPDDYLEALKAIENHDNKEYRIITRPDEMLAILSVSDDMDAFGFAGIYRYIEIYLQRKVPLHELCNLISENATDRFRNLIVNYRMLDEFLEWEIKRYEILKSFCDEYNNQASSYNFGSNEIRGYCGIAEIINKSIAEHIPLFKAFSTGGKEYDSVIMWYFNELKIELSDISEQSFLKYYQ
jgi:hypothetical protein